MAYYDLPKDERQQVDLQIFKCIKNNFIAKETNHLNVYFADEDTYIRKVAYLAVGKIYFSNIRL